MALIALIGIFRICQALCCLVSAANAHDTARRLLLWTWTGQPLDPALVAAVRTEIASLAIPGFSSVDFENSRVAIGAANDFLVPVQIAGSCNVNNDPLVNKSSPLGYVNAAGGKIDPMIFVNCRAILHAIRPFILEQPRQLQYKLLARAIVCVIRHELRHILEQTAGHLTTGIYRARLYPQDLIAQ